jgi:8-oxo-dGTP diphosphatase
MTTADVKVVEVVAGLIFDQDRLLVCQRSLQSSFPLKWEFPGGKVEKGEAHEVALRRELKEELGIQAHCLKEVFRHAHLYPGISKVDLTFFQVMDYSGDVSNRVFQQIKWISIRQLEHLDFLEADLPLVQKLVSAPSTVIIL